MRRWVNVLVLVLVVLVAGGVLAITASRLREAAAWMRCFNNLKLLRFAVENYYANYGRYPAAAMPARDGLPPERRLSWQVAVLPYIENSPDYRRLDLEGAWDSDKNRFLASEPYHYFECGGLPGRPPTGELVPTHYV